MIDWRAFQFENSPFFIHGTDPAAISRIYGNIEQGKLGDWAIAKELVPLISKHKMHFFEHFDKNELNKLYGTTSHNAEIYSFGLFAPVVLVDASFAWIDSGKSVAISQMMKIFKVYHTEFIQYLTHQLPLCYRNLLMSKNCLNIFQHTRLYPFQKDVYFRVGVEASNDCFLMYARDVAKMHNAIEYGYKS